jgi:protein SCO1/2
MLNKFLKIFASLVVIFIIAAWWYMAQEIKKNTPYQSALPYYGADTNTAESYMVEKFQFVNQYGDSVSRKTFENKIWVTDFFFTTCEGICPIMSKNLVKVQDSFKNNPNIKILSHTVDPQYDNQQVLFEYAQKHQAIKGKWHFVTGEASKIYHLARYSYFVATPQDSTYGEDFVHSQLIALIDPHLHIRGYYDGTNGKDMIKLIQDIKELQKEYPQAR